MANEIFKPKNPPHNGYVSKVFSAEIQNVVIRAVRASRSAIANRMRQGHNPFFSIAKQTLAIQEEHYNDVLLRIKESDSLNRQEVQDAQYLFWVKHHQWTPGK